ncbi:MAG: ATP-binding cassette domain-containing protein [Polyangiales bacterium]
MVAAASPLAPLDGHGADGHGRSPFARVRALLRLERDDLWVVLVYATATGLLSLATPVAAQALVSTVAFGSLLQPVAVLTALLFTVLSTAALLRALQVRVVEALQQRVFVRVALEVAHRLPRASASARDGAHGPEQVNRFFDVLTLQKSAAVFLLDALGLVLQTAIGLVVLAFYHPLLLAFDVVLIACVAALLFGMGRGATRTSIAESKAKYAVAAWLEEVARMPYALRSRSGAEHAAASADAATRAYLDARRAHFSVVYRQIVGSLALQAVASAALLGVGGALVIARQLTLGQLVAAEIIVTMVVASLAKLGKHLETWYDLMAAADKLGHLLDLEVEAAPSQPAASAEGPAALRVRGVRVEGGPRLDLDLAPGGRAVITAPSGAGKTRLAEALCGLRAPTEGVVELDGLDARELDPLARREATALVGGEVEVFAGTVRENVSLGRPQVGAREVWGALAAVGVDEAVRALPQGLDAKLLPSGAPLSQSQARLVGLARALAGSPRLLVLDDALSGLDQRSRRRAEDAVSAPSAPWTLVVLSREAMSAPRGVVALSLAAPGVAPAARGDA